jgi:hypothetical protein
MGFPIESLRKKDMDEQLARFFDMIEPKNKKQTETKLSTHRDKIDIYSMGITLLELKKHFVINDNSSTLLITYYLQRMVNLNPFERPDWEYVIEEHNSICNAIVNFSKNPAEVKKI